MIRKYIIVFLKELYTFSNVITPYTTIPGEQIKRIISYNISLFSNLIPLLKYVIATVLLYIDRVYHF